MRSLLMMAAEFIACGRAWLTVPEIPKLCPTKLYERCSANFPVSLESRTIVQMPPQREYSSFFLWVILQGSIVALLVHRFCFENVYLNHEGKIERVWYFV